jgi:hypothetical protein
MNDFELKNKLEMIFQQLLDIKFHLGEIESEKKCKEIENDIKIQQERLESLHNIQSTRWQYRENLEKDFRNSFEKQFQEYTKFNEEKGE